jgi:hypothetical protein
MHTPLWQPSCQPGIQCRPPSCNMLPPHLRATGPYPKWHENLHHRTVVSINKGAPPHRLSPLKVASTWATTSRHPPFSPALFFELTPAIFIVSSISSIFPINVKKRQAPLAVGISPRLSLKLVYWRLVPTSQRRSSRREQQEGANPTSPTMDRFLEMCDSECWDIAIVYIWFAPLLCLFSSWAMLMLWEETHVSVTISESCIFKSLACFVSFLYASSSFSKRFYLILLSNLGTRFFSRGVGCNIWMFVTSNHKC